MSFSAEICTLWKMFVKKKQQQQQQQQQQIVFGYNKLTHAIRRMQCNGLNYFVHLNGTANPTKI